jgi:hypothetical protein
MLMSQLAQLLSLHDKRMGGADTRLDDLNTKLQHCSTNGTRHHLLDLGYMHQT